jgi:hypothetical protein
VTGRAEKMERTDLLFTAVVSALSALSVLSAT